MVVTRRYPGSRRRHWLGWLVRLLLLLLLLWLAGLVWFVLAQPQPAPAGVRTDGVAVLTGGGGRLARGIEVMQAGLAKRMLVSGVDRSARPEELRDAAAIPPALFGCCVDLGFVASNTRSNADEVAAWVARNKYSSVRIVTASYHMRRAHAEIAARLPADVAVVTDAVPSLLSPFGTVREYGKFLAARLLLFLGLSG
jgi:uncharacterized SAM-binding protein YcdF (DUF218 family)